jgi:hypothetical protein
MPINKRFMNTSLAAKSTRAGLIAAGKPQNQRSDVVS